MKVLILGGSGVFGSRLAALLQQAGHTVIITSRTASKAEAIAADLGVLGASFSRSDDLPALFKAIQPDVVVDAAGPFQLYEHTPYRIAKEAITAGIHYLDFSDDAAFTAGITVLDRDARRAGTAVLSGASSVPAISSAIAADLAQKLNAIAIIESAILPGNQAPRGRAVMEAILAQVGEPIEMWRGGRKQRVRGWSGEKSYTLPGALKRKAAFIGAPDLALFPDHFKAESVVFRAGLELTLFQRSLIVLCWLRQRRLVPRLERFTGLFHWAAGLFEGMGSDRGGMVVSLGGYTDAGDTVLRRWRLRVDHGKGPKVPALPAAIIINQWSQAAPTPGARPCLTQFSRAAIEDQLAAIGGRIQMDEDPAPLLFERVLASKGAAMPGALRPLHAVWDRLELCGAGTVTRGKGPLARLICLAIGFPSGGPQPKICVEMTRKGSTERWVRTFGRQQFRSTVWAEAADDGKHQLFERFGLVTSEIELKVEGGALVYPVKRATLFNLPLPKWLTPISHSREWAEDGAFHFDVALSLPIAGDIIRYQGTLRRHPQ